MAVPSRADFRMTVTDFNTRSEQTDVQALEQRIIALELQNQLQAMKFDALVALVDRQRREQVALRSRVDMREWVD